MAAKENSLYARIGGFDKILAVTERWHELCLADPIAAHPFEHELHPHHSLRLSAYLDESFAGPALYTAVYGDESSMQKLHACNGLHIELDEACLAAFDQSLLDVHIAPDAASDASAYFRSATEEQRKYGEKNVSVPEGLPLNYA